MLEKIGLLIFTILLLISCARKKEEVEIDWDKNKSVEMSKRIAQKEKLDIAMYLENRKNYKMIQTGSGLYYHIYKTTQLDSVRAEMEAGVQYTISFLNGDTCYATPKEDVVYFKVDHSEIESGIQEGIKKMKLGEKAIFIIPSHLAHGISGDNNKIPPLTTLVVDLELVNLR